MVVALMMIMSAVAVIRMRQSITLLDADKAANQIAEQIRYARQIGLDDRRNVLVEFISPNRIKITKQDTPTPTVLYDQTLPFGYSYALPAGVAADTPDAYGNAAGVSFNGGTNGTFLGDGSFTDNLGIVLNGSVFTINGSNNTARAVTLAGASGRIRTYRVSGAAWVAR
jgi:type II secretory pathway pseudopilin PulG